MFWLVLVPLDGSPLSEQALPTAIEIARRARAKLRIVRVHEMPPETVDGTDLRWLGEQTRADATRYLESLAERLHREHAIEVSTELLEAAPATAICDAASRAGADLIVMTTHGRSGLSRLWLGSVAEGVARHATIPVLLFKPAEADGAPRPGTQGLFTKVLVALDGTDVAEAVLPPAMSLGRLFDAHYTLVRVVPPIMIASSVSPFGEVTYMEDVAQMEQRTTSVENYLHSVAAKMQVGDKPAQVATHVSMERSAAGAILRYAASDRADLIALTTHTKGVARALFGSVADKVLRGSEVPVLIYRPPTE
jgi:nucleotide-binding universal stress UspA family protein